MTNLPHKVGTTRATFHPWAECQTEGCDWHQGSSPATRETAKRHVSTFGHRVLVVAEDRTLYAARDSGDA